MKRILFQGDSITDVHRGRDNLSAANVMGCGYPLLLKARLNCDEPGAYECVNLGISGNRVVDLYARIQRDFINVRPDILSILIGVNDVWHGVGENPNGVSAPKFERVYDWLLTEVRESLPKVQLIILEPFVLPGAATQSEEDPERWEIFSREVPLRAQAARRVAEKHGAVFVPLQARLDKLSENTPPSHWLRDGVHPTEAGHEVIARAWMEAFKTL
ncbi:MAG: SGNH/GDSL hydrolase family protein [Clostridia bacterium]|nr:SGNH/GDSL hydrolase family protein [Clostridia bacterium]